MATFSQTGTYMRRGRLIAWVVAALCGLGAFWPPRLGSGPGLAQAQREVPPSWDFFIDLPDLARGVAEVTWTLRGFGPERPLRVCGDMNDAERYVGRIERLEWEPAAAVGEGSWGAGPGPGPQLRGGPGRRPLRRDGRCWRVPDADPRGVVLRYTYDLRELAARNGSPDYAQRLGETYIFNDETILLRPDPLPRGGGAPEPLIRIELRLPPGAQVATPWQRQPGPGQRFFMDAAQYDGGGYVMVGTIEDLGEVRLPHTTVHVVTLPAERRLSGAALRSWVGSALSAVDRFYGTLTPRHVLVNLVPVPGSQEASLFGTVLRPLRPSVVIYFGADCERAENPDEWVAVHELFHIGNPWLSDRMPWFVEGFTTYYQDVLRARMSGGMTAPAAWGDLWDGARRFCHVSSEAAQGYNTSDRPLTEDPAAPFAVEFGQGWPDPGAARPVLDMLRDPVQGNVHIPRLQIAGDVGEPRAEQKGMDPVAVAGDGVEEMQEKARIAAHGAGNVAQHHQRRMAPPL